VRIYLYLQRTFASLTNDQSWRLERREDLLKGHLQFLDVLLMSCTGQWFSTGAYNFNTPNPCIKLLTIEGYDDKDLQV
jgi:hypothetical protein